MSKDDWQGLLVLIAIITVTVALGTCGGSAGEPPWDDGCSGAQLDC